MIMGKDGIFRFKQFECRHYHSSMRIGVDAVLLGAWADVSGDNILDVGTGCGVISLMTAQRNPRALIKGIDVDLDSIIEATLNFRSSPWADRLNAESLDFNDMPLTMKYDLIISNPPYFNSGGNAGESVRMRARHEDTLSPASILLKGKNLLTPDGRIAVVVPYIRAEEIIAYGTCCGMHLSRRTDVKGNASAPFKRSLLEFGTKPCECIHDSLTLEEAPNEPTEQHRAMCKEFYLRY